SDSEFSLEFVLEFEGKLFRSADQQTNSAKIAFFATTNVKAEESGSAEEDSCAVRSCQVSHFFCLALFGMQAGRASLNKWCPETDGVTKTVEERKDAEKPVGRFDSDCANCRFDIVPHIAMSQHNAFWLSGAAAGENNREGVIDLVPVQSQHESINQHSRE